MANHQVLKVSEIRAGEIYISSVSGNLYLATTDYAFDSCSHEKWPRLVCLLGKDEDIVEVCIDGIYSFNTIGDTLYCGPSLAENLVLVPKPHTISFEETNDGNH